MGPLRIIGLGLGSTVLYFFLKFCTIGTPVAIFFAVGAFVVGLILYNENPSWSGPRRLEEDVEREKRRRLEHPEDFYPPSTLP